MERFMRRRSRMTNRAAAQAETRERIVRAPMALHDERGVATTSFADIASRPATVFRHFPTLNSLVVACGARVAGEMQQQMRRGFSGA
jgi:AcrR family transcriptional regulator